MAFCHACGKKGVRGLCEECKEKDELCRFCEMQLEFCFRCGRANIASKWKDYKSLKEAVIACVKYNMKTKSPKTKIKIKPILKDINMAPKVKEDILVEIEARLDHFEKYIVPLRLIFKTCDHCNLIKSNYYEGVLQLRNIPKDHAEIFDFLKSEIRKNNTKGVNVMKEVKVKGGLDIYLTSGKFIKSVSTKLFKKFGGDLKTTAKIHTRDKQTCKDVYRVFAMVRFSELMPGDIIEFKKNIHQVTSISAKKVTCNSIKTQQKTSIDLSREAYQLVAKKKDFMKTKISKIHPTVEVIDPKTFQSIPVNNQRNDLKLNQNVKVFYWNGIWII